MYPQDDQNLYVSPDGDDLNDGSLESPFKTIEKARNTIRKLEIKQFTDVTVHIRGGVHVLSKTLTFDSRDSGTRKFKITYQAYGDERPVISGGSRLGPWTKTSESLYKTQVGDHRFRQLYVNGKRAVRARNPNSGGYYRNLLWDVDQMQLLLDARRLQNWKNFKEVELVVNMNWAEAILRLDSYTESNDEPYSWHTPKHARLTVQQPERNLVFKRHYPPKRNELAWYFENAMEFLDEPGEWYHDRSERTLYYYPRDDEDMSSASATIPKLETLVHLKGILEQPIINLHFEGLTFSHSGWTRPSVKGALNLQACNYTIPPTDGNQQFVERIKSAVLVEAAERCSFFNNTFTHLGASGLDLLYGTSNILVDHNTFTDISANGIQVATFSDPDTEMHRPFKPSDSLEICRNDIVSNNIIHKIGQDYTGAVGIACGYVRQIKILHNEIYDLPYTGISVGWGWSSEENAMKNNIIRGNLIHDVCKIMSDGGAIYTLSAQEGSQITENYIYDVRQAPWAGRSINTGIYLDEGSKGILVEDNVVENIESGVPFILKGECIFKNNFGVVNEEVKNNAGLNEQKDK